MLQNFFKTAFRNLRRHKGQSFINILGLSVGLACSFLIVLWVQDELSYNQFHKEKDQLHRMMMHMELGGQIHTMSSIPKPLDDVLVDEYPEITHTVLMSWEWQMLLTNQDRTFRVDGRYFGPDLFNIFSFPLLVGDPETVLQSPESIVLSASMAENYFGPDWMTRDDVIGAPITIDGERDVEVTGVFADIPKHSSIRFDFALPIEAYNRDNPWVDDWGNDGLRMFVRLEEGADYRVVSAKIKDLRDRHAEEFDSDLFLQPISDWHLRSDYENGVLVGGRIEYVRIFLIVAGFLILIAAINFMNLATARSRQRAKEIGVRKSVGASKSLLARQFLAESVLMAVLALAAAGVIVLAAVGPFDTLTGKAMSNVLSAPGLWLVFGGIALVTGLLAGSYPALYLSSFSVVGVLKGDTGGLHSGASLRKGLVVFQFVLTIVLLVGTFVVHRQLEYIRTKDLGLDRENVVYLEYDGDVETTFDAFKAELEKKPGIMSAATTGQNPLAISRGTIGVQWDGKHPDDNTTFRVMWIGHGFTETMGMQLKAGRFFSEEFASDSAAFVVNEKAAEVMGMDNPVGQQIEFWEEPGTIVGVVKDFHNTSLHEPIRPTIMRFNPGATYMVFVRLAGGETEQGLASLEEVYGKFNPGYPFTYRFLDAEFEETYRSEVVIGTLANVFAFVAILIACLGLFGLASFTAEQRTKEIGVRKVLGASVPSVVRLLSREFVMLVAGAFLVAAPVSYLLMDRWLQNFEFRTDLDVGVLIGAGVLALVIAWMTVAYHSIKVAMANPVVALRSE